MNKIKIVLLGISLNALCAVPCVANLLLLILQIMLCTINSFQLLTNRSIPVIVNGIFTIRFPQCTSQRLESNFGFTLGVNNFTRRHS